jgi:hypothetical protein
MTKRLQVLVDDAELAEIQRAARGSRMTVAAWVRDAIRRKQEHDGARDYNTKLDVVAAAARHTFRTPDIGR